MRWFRKILAWTLLIIAMLAVAYILIYAVGFLFGAEATSFSLIPFTDYGVLFSVKSWTSVFWGLGIIAAVSLTGAYMADADTVEGVIDDVAAAVDGVSTSLIEAADSVVDSAIDTIESSATGSRVKNYLLIAAVAFGVFLLLREDS